MAFMMDFSTICRPGREKEEPSSAQHTLLRTGHPRSHLTNSQGGRVSSPAPPGHRWDKPHDISRTPNCSLPAAHHPYSLLGGGGKALGIQVSISSGQREQVPEEGSRGSSLLYLFIPVPAEETLQKDEISPESSPGRIHPQPAGQGAGPQSWQGAPSHQWARGDLGTPDGHLPLSPTSFFPSLSPVSTPHRRGETSSPRSGGDGKGTRMPREENWDCLTYWECPRRASGA